MATAAIVYTLIVVCVLLAFGIHAWRQRRDFWIYTNSAPYYTVGEITTGMPSPGDPVDTRRFRVIRVTRAALLVRPL